MFFKYEDLIDNMIGKFDAMDIRMAPNYRARLMMKTALDRYFDSDTTIAVLGKMNLDVSLGGIEADNFPALVDCMARTMDRVYKQLIEDVGAADARELLIHMSTQFSLVLE